MRNKAVPETMLALIIIGLLTSAFNIQPAKAWAGTVYIQADGSVYPSDAPILREGSLYALTDNINTDADGIVVQRDNVILDGAGYTTQGAGAHLSIGIHLLGRINVTVRNMTIKAFWTGVSLNYSSHSCVLHDDLMYNNVAVSLESGNSNIIESNIIEIGWASEYQRGVHGSGSNNAIVSNLMKGTRWEFCIDLIGSNNTVINNEVSIWHGGWVSFGFWLEGFNNIVSDNNFAGGNGIGTGLLTKGSDNNITNNYLNSDYVGLGVYVGGGRNIVSGNMVEGRYNLRGISFDGSHHVIFNNTVLGRSGEWGAGILGDRGSYNLIISNVVRDKPDGVYLVDSQDNLVLNNTLVNNGNGIHIEYWRAPSGKNTISFNVIEGNGNGIYLGNSSENTAFKNRIANNNKAIIVSIGSYNNTLLGNNIEENVVGIQVENSMGNKIYHNNFLNNTCQAYSIESLNAWDDDYPSGGNYWSDYTGIDMHSGRYQNLTGSDGIGDAPYTIDAKNTDRYPFMTKSEWEVPTPEQAILDLITTVQEMNLQHGIANSLDAKLANVLASLQALKAEQRNDTINKLYAFINEVEAQRGNKITDEQADYLIAKAQEIINLLQ